MRSLREIRRHIHAVREIRHIARALRTVAAARLKRAQARVEAARPYARKISEVLVDIAELIPENLHPLLEVRDPPNRVGVIVMTSDTGLCGRFNQDIIQAALALIRDVGGRDETDIIAVGKIGRDYFRRNGYNLLLEYTGPERSATFARAESIAREITARYNNKELDHVYIVYSRFYSPMEQSARVFRLVPVRPMKDGGGEEAPAKGACLFVPSPEEVLGLLVSRYLETAIYRALLETDASECGARMTAMTGAADNATEMIDKLTLDYHRSRQAAITREIAEIISGAEAVT